MSLDVYLTMKDGQHVFKGPRIFIREDGQNKAITREEWNQRFPGREPVTVDEDDQQEVYSANITHNLTSMADAAGIYMALWRPEEIGITHADQMILPLRAGLALLRSNPARFTPYNPENGWGTYEGFVTFVENYLAACERYPVAEVSVSR